MRAHNNVAGASPLRQPTTGDRLELAADVLGHLAQPVRLHLLRLLAEGEQDVTTLTAQVDATRSSVSQHLGRLRIAGLVQTRRDGRRVVYRITSDHLRELVEQAYQFAGHLVDHIPHHYAER
ncbi:ArsR/SmtB family transcription factor [Pseudonocardia acaciae]|uniref:ArsR/SmtB family transcription factor n=1 Tax=Pseudonocardia acaciae TaxID=551276 RepID=UPI00048D6244|nr:metalloregulator ArsR/SmtB family transcription factor [Pseudonocardia acaciae]